MSILVSRASRVLVQGITGRAARAHTRLMQAYGTQVVAGVTPGRGGEQCEGVRVFDTVREALEATGANVAAQFLPPLAAADGMLEAIEAGMPVIFCLSEGVPQHDMIPVLAALRRSRCRLIGPNCPGAISPGETKVGFLPDTVARPGPVGIVSRSGTLSYEVAFEVVRAGLGQSTWLCIGGDPLKGTSFVDVLDLFRDDPATRAVALIGEIGGDDEELAAEHLARGYPKPVVALVAGRSAPEGKAMGHAGAIILGNRGGHRAKVAALRQAGAQVAESPAHAAGLLAGVLRG